MRFLILSLLFLFIGCAQSPKIEAPIKTSQECFKNRAAFDIGSGETKLKVAKVDVCKSKIVTILLESKRDVNFKGDLQKRNSQVFSQEVMDQGRNALRELKQEASPFSPSEFTSVATQAFREAKNAKSYVESLNLELKINIQIIEQKEEGILGFYSAQSRVENFNIDESIVWDIGGGSMQLIAPVLHKGKKQFAIYEGKMASTPFKNHITRNIQNKKTDSPNPLKSNQAKIAEAFAKNIARKTVRPEIKNAISKKFKVYGVGGVHNYSIGNQLPENQKIYTSTDLEKIIESRINKTDEELGGQSYVGSDTSNPILIKAFMEELEISDVEIVKANLADGLLVNHKYWAP